MCAAGGFAFVADLMARGFWLIKDSVVERRGVIGELAVVEHGLLCMNGLPYVLDSVDPYLLP